MQFLIISSGAVLYFLFVISLPFIVTKFKNFYFKFFRKPINLPIKIYRIAKAIFSLLSVDYSFVKSIKIGVTGKERGEIIRKRNNCNLFISFVAMLLSFFVVLLNWNMEYLIPLLLGFNGYRFISRSLEIIIAFGIDVLEKEQSRSLLEKSHRINLAIKSYFEIYLYSISFYVSHLNLSPYEKISNHCDNSVTESLVMSLSVGTLTNVAYAQDNFSNWLKLLPLVQVFATLSLVVLSLAVYVSRDNKK